MKTFGANVGFGYVGDDDDESSGGGTLPTVFNAIVSGPTDDVLSGDSSSFFVNTSFSTNQTLGEFYVVVEMDDGTPEEPVIVNADGWSDNGWSYDSTNTRWYTKMTKASVTSTSALEFAVVLDTDTTATARIRTYLDSSFPHTATASGSGNQITFDVVAVSFDVVTTAPSFGSYDSNSNWFITATVVGNQTNGVIWLYADCRDDATTGGCSKTVSPESITLAGWTEDGWVNDDNARWYNRLTKSSVAAGTYDFLIHYKTKPNVAPPPDGVAPTTVWLSTNRFSNNPQTDQAEGSGNDFYVIL